MSHVQNFHLVCLDKNSYCKLKLKTKFPLLVNETSLFHFSTILADKYTKGKLGISFNLFLPNVPDIVETLKGFLKNACCENLGLFHLCHLRPNLSAKR